MTRINCVSVDELCNQHLFAEWREMPRVVSSLHKSMHRKNKPFTLDEIPDRYCLGPGHVKFFYDKFQYLYKRYNIINNELIARGYDLSEYSAHVFLNTPTYLFNDWKPDTDDLELNRARIRDRMPKKPQWGKIK